jgi:hypothetical protein
MPSRYYYVTHNKTILVDPLIKVLLLLVRQTVEGQLVRTTHFLFSLSHVEQSYSQPGCVLSWKLTRGHFQLLELSFLLYLYSI